MSDSGLGLAAASGHRSTKRTGRGFGCVAALLVVALVGLGLYVVATIGVRYLHDRLSAPADFSGQGHGSVRVTVKKGQTAAQIATTLARRHVVASAESFTDAAATNPDSTRIQPGVYAMRKEMSAESALLLLIGNRNRVETRFAVPEGLRTDEIVAAVARQTNLSSSDLRTALKHPGSLGLPAYAQGHPEGYLFPASYTIGPGTSATEVLSMMVDRFDQAAKDTNLLRGARQLGLSPHDVVTVASLVQAEARRPQDFGKVARVIYNRDNAGMALQLDSTVHYVAGSRGKVYSTQQERRIDSPYNTYLYPGLPPGAIGAPGEAALQAALHPTRGGWLYFVTVNPDTGRTLFAKTLRAHNANVAKLKRYCQTSPSC